MCCYNYGTYNAITFNADEVIPLDMRKLNIL